MRLPLAWLCLLLALAGPLLDQSRRAYGFGLSLEELGQNRYESADEEADEDVAGDALTILAIASPHGLHPSDLRGWDGVICWGELPLFDHAQVFEVVRYRHASGQDPPTAPQRQASLQIFLF